MLYKSIFNTIAPPTAEEIISRQVAEFYEFQKRGVSPEEASIYQRRGIAPPAY